MWQLVQGNEWRIFTVIVTTYAAGVCFIYSPAVSTRAGGVLMCVASLMAGQYLLGFGWSMVVCSVLLMLVIPPSWTKRQSLTDSEGPDVIGRRDDGRNERIVQLCSADNEIEASALQDVLEEAGIPARVVGDFVANMAGGLPFAKTLVWVREQDAARAREVAAEWTARSQRPPADGKEENG